MADLHINAMSEKLISRFKPNNLTHWGHDEMTAIFQTTFSNVFSWMKMYEFRLGFHLGLFLMVQLTTSSIGLDKDLAPLSESMMVDLSMHNIICVTRP